MSLNYNEKFPDFEHFTHEIHEPEKWLDKYVIISTNVCAFSRDAREYYNKHYSLFPHTKVVGIPVRGNCTTNFFIVMDKSWWNFVKKAYDGDMNRYYKSLLIEQLNS